MKYADGNCYHYIIENDEIFFEARKIDITTKAGLMLSHITESYTNNILYCKPHILFGDDVPDLENDLYKLGM